jgi:hypothetical protein
MPSSHPLDLQWVDQVPPTAAAALAVLDVPTASFTAAVAQYVTGGWCL